LNNILEVKNISKKFPGTQALRDVSIEFFSNEIHAIVGENGAGKSTLIKILAGIYSRDSGEISINGRTVAIKTPRDSYKEGFRFIHQELLLVPQFTVAQNIYLGNFPTAGPLKAIDLQRMRKDAEAVLKRLGVDIDCDKIVSELSIADMQIVAIARSIASSANILVLDEPTAPLNPEETLKLFEILRNYRNTGALVIYISHRLEEIFSIADRVTVLRDGEVVETTDVAKTSLNNLVKSMIGRSLADKYPPIEDTVGEKTVIRVTGLHKTGSFEDISFEVREGEILGLAGLAGAGRTELLRTIFGQERAQEGGIEFLGETVSVRSPRQAKKIGISYVPEDRRAQGLVTAQSVKFNTCSTIYDSLTFFGFVNRRKEVSTAREFVKRLSIATPNVNKRVKYLSGGNQQKVVVSKWLAKGSKLFLFNGPTIGVDVGAKFQIYELIRELARAGAAVILVSSEIPELLGMCHRILVMYKRRIVKEFKDSQSATKEQILTFSVGGGSS